MTTDAEILAAVERQRKSLASHGVREPQLTTMAWEFAYVERLLARCPKRTRAPEDSDVE